jgi:hypothetical protein
VHRSRNTKRREDTVSVQKRRKRVRGPADSPLALRRPGRVSPNKLTGIANALKFGCSRSVILDEGKRRVLVDKAVNILKIIIVVHRASDRARVVDAVRRQFVPWVRTPRERDVFVEITDHWAKRCAVLICDDLAHVALD